MAVSPTTLPIPAVDDRKLYELRATRHALPTLTVAKEMELFERLEKGPKTIEEMNKRYACPQGGHLCY
jgi:glutamine synthetase type III